MDTHILKYATPNYTISPIAVSQAHMVRYIYKGCFTLTLRIFKLLAVVN